MKPQRWYTTTQVGLRVGRHRSQVRLMVERGLFPHATRHAGGAWRIPEADVAAYLEAHRPRVRRRQSA